MTDLVLSTGERVPPLADTAVVHEDGDWKLVRQRDMRYQLWLGDLIVGTCMRDYPLDGWWVYLALSAREYKFEDLSDALSVMWAARGA